MLGLLMTLENDDDRELAESIWRRYESRMYNFAFSLLHNRADAEDVQMIVISRVINNIDKFRSLPDEDTTALIYTYTKNASITIYNQNKLKLPVEVQLSDSSFGLEQAECAVIEDEKVKRLKEQILALPEKYSSVLILCSVMGLKTGEAAKMLGISAAKAYSRLNYAKTLLQKEFDKNSEEKSNV